MKKSVIALIVTFIILMLMYGYAVNTEGDSAVTVNVITPKIKTVNDYISTNGRVKAKSKKNLHVENPAEILEIYVKIGDSVKKDEPLFKIKPIDSFNFNEITLKNDALTELIKQYIDVTEEINLYSHIGSECVIKSPIDGTVTSINVTPEDKVCSLNTLMSISDFSDLYVDILIPEERFSEIKNGMDVIINSPAFKSKSFKGKIDLIYPTARYIPSITGDGKTYIRAKATFNNEKELLCPEMSVSVKIIVKTIKNAITVPYECILQDEKNREYVFCVEDGIAKKRYIASGYELDNEIHIKTGIVKNSKIIINPSNEIEDKQKVNILE